MSRWHHASSFAETCRPRHVSNSESEGAFANSNQNALAQTWNLEVFLTGMKRRSNWLNTLFRTETTAAERNDQSDNETPAYRNTAKDQE